MRGRVAAPVRPAVCATVVWGKPDLTGPRPPAIPPRCEHRVLISYVWGRIVAMSAPRMAARETCRHEPEAAPSPIAINGAQRVLGTRRLVPALPANKGFQRPAIDVNGRFQNCLRHTGKRRLNLHSRRPVPLAAQCPAHPRVCQLRPKLHRIPAGWRYDDGDSL